MSQDNSILDLLDIKDKNIQIEKVEERIRYDGPQRIHTKIIHGRLTYGLSRCPLCGFPSLVKDGTRLTKLRITSLTGKNFDYFSANNVIYVITAATHVGPIHQL